MMDNTAMSNFLISVILPLLRITIGPFLKWLYPILFKDEMKKAHSNSKVVAYVALNNILTHNGSVMTNEMIDVVVETEDEIVAALSSVSYWVKQQDPIQHIQMEDQIKKYRTHVRELHNGNIHQLFTHLNSAINILNNLVFTYL